jgi:type I restriction-modification system DNA methylase subunit
MSQSSGKASGLVAVDDKIYNRSAHETVSLISAQKCEADYVYFRRFDAGRPSLPQVYIYDNTNVSYSDAKIAELHRKVWNRGEAPLMYVFSRTSVNIFSCVRGPDFLSETGILKYNPAKTLLLASAVQAELDRFSGQILDSGAFWDNPDNDKLINKNKAAHQSLVTAIKDFDKALSADNILPAKFGRRLLILCILVKYLEDRKVFPSNYFKKIRSNANHFFDVLKDADATIGLFEDLEKRFNGDVFILTESEKQAITTESLQRFATVIEGKTLGLQMHFWELYSFEDIPVEVISYIYQNFVTGNGAVYTPHFLVDLLLNESMPLEKLQESFKVFDPACGSGVFLVGAYKRLINAWRYRNGWKEPEIKTLKTLLMENIYGVDLESMAVELTAFSLLLALCDALQPNVIWNKLRFEKLKTNNIRQCDFFSCDVIPHFDLLIGNPPFESKLTTVANAVNKGYEKERGVLPDKQFSYLFAEHGLKFLKSGGKLCLIMPHGILYNTGTENFRKHLFSSWHLEEVLDFISIRGLFESADVKVCALIMQNIKPDYDKPVAHITFRRNRNTHEQLSFEIDHYDVNYISRDLAISDRLIWRANLLGGARVYAITERISKLRNLNDFIQSKRWEFGEGFITTEKKDDNGAPFITGKRHLPTKAFTEAGIDESELIICKNENFATSHSEKRYTPPMILIKEHNTFPVAFWEKEYLTFRNSIISISGAKSSELRTLFGALQKYHRDYRFFLIILGSRAMVGKATSVLKQDIDDLPYPENPEDIQLSKYEQIIRDDILDYMEDFIRLGHKSTLLTMAASNGKALGQFGEIYCEVLAPVYKSIMPYEPIVMRNMICYPFYFGKKPEIDFGNPEKFEKYLNNLVQRQHCPSLQISRIVRLYEGNVIYLIKPNKLRYWTRSIAIRDADETFAELRTQGV